MRQLYTFIIWLTYSFGKVHAIFSSNTKKWYAGRKDQAIDQQISQSIWVHCASLGEYFQIKSLIKEIKKNAKDQSIVLTFFSPSGYDNFKDDSLIDNCYYLPADLPSKMKDCISKINPKLVIFTKNEVWFNLMHSLDKKNIPFVFTASTFDKTSNVLSLAKLPFFSIIKKARSVCVQEVYQKNYLKKLGFQNVIAPGDPRIDEVLEVRDRSFEDEKINAFLANGHQVCVCGSTDHEDERRIISVLKDSRFDKIIIAPHHIDEDRIEEVQTTIGRDFSMVYTDENPNFEKRWMILNTMGQLSSVYRYADIVYIGGGFSEGIHNTLEPAAYHKPMIFGPRYHKFWEAESFVRLNAARVVKDKTSLRKAIKFLLQKNEQQKIEETLIKYFEKNKGATAKIYASLKLNTLLS